MTTDWEGRLANVCPSVVGHTIVDCEADDGDAVVITLDDGRSWRIRPLQLTRGATLALELGAWETTGNMPNDG